MKLDGNLPHQPLQPQAAASHAAPDGSVREKQTALQGANTPLHAQEPGVWSPGVGKEGENEEAKENDERSAHTRNSGGGRHRLLSQPFHHSIHSTLTECLARTLPSPILATQPPVASGHFHDVELLT